MKSKQRLDKNQPKSVVKGKQMRASLRQTGSEASLSKWTRGRVGMGMLRKPSTEGFININMRSAGHGGTAISATDFYISGAAARMNIIAKRYPHLSTNEVPA